ncbi:MAG: hypothetical protein J6R13_01650 [Alistipes sp.]|nr:hypothetical protein [Alistipes sp.]
MKNIFYALFAFVALVMVGCTADQTYTPGEDLSGEQIYIDNSMSEFYVQTADEKKELAEELKKLSRGLQKEETYVDDTYVDLKIARKSSSLEQFDFEVKLTMLAEDAALFTLPKGSTQTGADQAAKTVVFTVPCSFDADASETVLRLGFDISQLATNTNYEFIAELVDLENSSNYGASDFEFSICHQITVELPFEDIGLVTLTDAIYTGAVYSDCVIQIHKDDKKAIEDARAAGTKPVLEAGYVRFFIPRPWYQMVAASVAAGDGNFEESDLDYFAMGDGVMVCLTTEYEPVAQDGNPTHPHPMEPTKYQPTFPQHPLVGIVSADGSLRGRVATGATEQMYMARVPFVDGGMEFYQVMFMPSYGFGATTRTMNTYSFGTAYWEPYQTGSLYAIPFDVVWDKNDLEADWANYFKVDYNNDINYTALGVGIFTSEYQGNFGNKYLYKGVEKVSGEGVYYVADPYGTQTQETGYLGLAMSWNGTTAKVVDMQPLNIQWNGRELYASQSQKIKSAIEFNESGNIVKLTFGVAIVNEEGQVLGDYTETFDIEAPEVGLETFLGEFSQYTYELYGPADPANATGSLLNAFYPLSSSVKIEQALDKAGNPIANKVKIFGLMPTDYDLSATPGGYLEGTYDPATNTIDVPAQFFHDMEWDGTPLVGQAMPIFPYFQPGVTTYANYNSKNSPTGIIWLSELAEEAGSIALHYANGMLEFGPSTNDTVSADGYSIILGYYEAAYDEFVVDAANMTLFTTISWPSIGVSNPTFVPASGGGAVAPLQKKFVKKDVNARENFQARKTRGEKVEFGVSLTK